MTEQPDNNVDEMQEIVDFLCGEKPLQGRWYGEKHPGIPTFWWRNNLRIAVRQLDQYYADFYRNKIPKKIEDDEGWDMAFEQSRGEVIECCPGDDMAYGFNKAVDLITAQFNSKEENV